MSVTETLHAGEFLLSEGDEPISREAGIITGGNYPAGKVLGQITKGTASAAAGTNTGNGAMGAITVGAGAQPGAYTLKITKAATNAGDFEVIDPQGDVCGVGTVAAAFAGGGLSFTLADGSTDFVVGDSFVLTVAAGSGKYTEHDPAATNGTETAAAILIYPTEASAADVSAAVVARLAEVDGSLLTWKSGISAGNKAAGIAALAAKNIIVR